MFRAAVILVVAALAPALALTPNNVADFDMHAAAGVAAPYAERKVPHAEYKFPPIPAATWCIVITTCQYMIVMACAAVSRTYHDATSTAPGDVSAAWKAAAQTVTYGPMLCLLFIGCRMRVEFLSDGKDEPQMWVQYCMYATTFALLGTTLAVLLVPLITGKPLPLQDDTPDIEKPVLMSAHSKDKTMFYVLSGVRCFVMLCLYGGLVGVIVGTCIYLPPGTKGFSRVPLPAPAIMCTIILSTLFFSTQLILAVARSYTEFTGKAMEGLVSVMNAAAGFLEFGPMLAVLFLAARMRALQHDGEPQVWAQHCMYASTMALSASTILAVAYPLAVGDEMQVDQDDVDSPQLQVSNSTLGYVLQAVRYITMFCFYGGAVGVCASIVLFEAPDGPEKTLPVSPAVHCVMNLAAQFFFVYALLMIMLTLSEFSGGSLPLETSRIFAAIEAAKATLGFAPMLSVLFVTTRMHALSITDKQGAPQAWVQDGMYMSTWSLLISFMSSLMTGCIMEVVEQDDDGNVTNKFESYQVNIFMRIVRYLAMFLLYAGIVVVIAGILTMTPENANGHGSVPMYAPPGAGTTYNRGLN